MPLNPKEKTAALRKALEDPAFKEARRIKANQLLRIRTPAPKVRQVLDQMLEDYTYFSQAQRLSAESHKTGAIAAMLKRNARQVRNWVEGTRKPQSIAQPFVGGKKKHKVSGEFTPEMAFLTAVYTANHAPLSGDGHQISIFKGKGAQEELYQEATQALGNAGAKVKITKKGAVINSTSLADWLEKYSTRKTSVPFHLLDTEDKIKQYLRALIMAHGTIHKGRDAIASNMKIEALPAFSKAVVLFPTLGLFPTFTTRKNGRVTVMFNGIELKKLAESGLLGETHGKKVEENLREIDNMERGRTSHGLDTVEKALRLVQQMKDPSKIASETGVSEITIRGWAHSAPTSAQRLARHYQIAEKIGYPVDHLLKWPFALQRGINSIERTKSTKKK